MIKTMRERLAEDPPKETRFVLRGRVVDPKDIARFEKRAQKKGTIKEGEPIDCEGEPQATTSFFQGLSANNESCASRTG
jgi:hypothetical protein